MILKKNYSLILFPEGWYHTEVPVGKLKFGIAKVAEETNAKVMPAVIMASPTNSLRIKI